MLPIFLSALAIVISAAALVVPYYRRPSLSLETDKDREHSHVEGDGVPYLRALVRNKKGKRAARHVRVVLDGYKRPGEVGWRRIGSPFLAWPSTFGQNSGFYVDVIFAGADRPVGVGRFVRVRTDGAGHLLHREVYVKTPGGVTAQSEVATFPTDPDATWYLRFEFDVWRVTDDRDWLAPDEWTLRFLVGADDGDSHACELSVAWKGDEPDSEAVLHAALESLTVKRVDRRFLLRLLP